MKKEPDKQTTEEKAPVEEPIINPNPAFISVAKEAYDAAVAQAGQSAELKDRLLRGQAEWENSRKRIIREKEDAVRYAAEGLLEKLLPVLDNLEMGMQAAKTATDAKSIAQGLEMVLKQFQQVLKDAGVETIDAVGQPFDAHRHDALGEQESNEHPEGHVVMQVRKGYKLKDRLLRAASVFVAKPSEGKQAGK
jgi:molecular chaperone GrpE